jgi:hypothetical protein
LSQSEAVNELHRNEVRSLALTNLIYMRDVRMVEGSRGRRFLFESPHPISI